MNKKMILNIFRLLIVVGLLSTVTFAWFAMQRRTGPIDIDSGDVQFSFKVDDSITQEFSTSRLTFFDIDSPDEVSYFIPMAIEIKITVYNTSNVDLNYSASQIDIGNGAYACCLFSNERLEAIEDTPTISEFLAQKQSANGAINGITNDIISSKDIYVYLFGVQENDISNNNFLSEKYNFRIRIAVTKN